MKTRTLLFASIVLVSFVAFGRIIKVSDPKTLIADSKLVFVGRVQSVKPSDNRTTLSYPTWEGVSFQWLRVEVKVLEPFKGVRKGDVVHTMMLSMDKSKEPGMYSPPGMLEPDKDDVFFLCLAPTTITNVFAALAAPFDENLSVFALHRSQRTEDFRDSTKRWLSRDKRFALIWGLVNEAGEILPDGAARLRDAYATEIGKVPTNNVIYLEWETYTNQSGWRSDVPKGFSPKTNSNSR